MDARTQGALLLAVGGVTVRLALTDAALTYIRPEYVPLQLIGGAVLLVLGAVTLARALRQPHPAIDHDRAAEQGIPADDGRIDDVHVDGGHDHEGGPRIAWMLAAPLFAILLIAPPPLGSFAANRQSGVIQSSASSYPPLPAATDGAVDLTLGDYTVRALYDTERSLADQRVRLTGFVSGTTERGWTLTRFALNCCAADGTAIDVEVVTDQPAPPVDQWVTVEGFWRSRAGHEIGELTADPPLLLLDELEPVTQPTEPYET